MVIHVLKIEIKSKYSFDKRIDIEYMIEKKKTQNTSNTMFP